MKKLNLKEMYELVLKYLESDYKDSGICREIAELFFDNHIDKTDYDLLLYHFKNSRPNWFIGLIKFGIIDTEFWWSPKWVKPRIRYVKYLIKSL